MQRVFRIIGHILVTFAIMACVFPLHTSLTKRILVLCFALCAYQIAQIEF